jgi:hypothetical protein
MEEIQFRSSHLTNEAKKYIQENLYENFDMHKNLKRQAEKNLQMVTKYAMNNFKNDN